MNRTIIPLPDHCDAIALCGGPYSNFAAVEAFLATTSGLPRFCLGDVGGAGPYPDRTIARIRESYVVCMQGNYDHAVGHDERDCGCGYVDTRDRQYAQLSYDYTAANTSETNKAWLRSLPRQLALEWRGKRILLVHGSPDSVNEWSTCYNVLPPAERRPADRYAARAPSTSTREFHARDVAAA